MLRSLSTAAGRSLTVANSTRSVIPRLVPSLPIATCHRYQSTSASTTLTSGLSFKKAKRHHRQLPFVQTVQPSAEEAVNNILYNTPGPSSGPETRHILSCLVRNEPGVLSRVSGVLAARGFNIDSLVVANTEVPDLSRMTIIFKGQNTPIEQARRQLEDVVPVWAVLDYTNTVLVERELLLVKTSILGPEMLHKQLPDTYHEEHDHGDDLEHHDEEGSGSAHLRNTFSHLRALTELARLFDGKVVDVSSDSVIIELCAKPSRINSFMKLLKPFGILEASRTGAMAMPRSPVHDQYEPQQEHSIEETGVDASMLPPG
ncbi:small subunit of acetolactate synthase-domain-containing protein [Umbelopsis sp. PMI_123]|nr:small subunit of acetolactate synthase-domain-containing protein [Umbelopsis sp. PMI_123]